MAINNSLTEEEIDLAIEAIKKEEMERKKEQYFVIPATVYPYTLHVYFGSDQSAFDRKMKRVFGDFGKYTSVPAVIKTRKGDGMIFTNYSENKPSHVVIQMPSAPKSHLELSTLIHELHHFCNGVMLSANIPLSETSEEAYTYYLDYLVREVLKHLKITYGE